jgi:glutamyl-tRNA(Gln) amidotransferase subunit E
LSSVNFYRDIGLKVGLEIHVQLDTKRKLFCQCPTTGGSAESAQWTLRRYLRPARSEVGEVDPAALLEWKRNRAYIYDVGSGASCLVEADEEPPHMPDGESLLVALAVAKALKMHIVDEVHVMRKIVIDGSNVSGFQRTMLIAVNGELLVEDRKIGVQTLCLEEDAAKKIEESETEVRYALDRLGIPLVEIATAPDIDSPELALKAALKIGQLVRLTGKAKRGLGSIRQDINISISKGAKVEIKGVQHLYLIPKIVEYEVQRQLKLLEIKDELLERGVSEADIDGAIVDVTEVFKTTQSKLIRKMLSQPNTVVLATKLPGFKGLLGREVQPGRRFGTELSDYAKAWGKVGGIIHTDELPGYGITSEEASKLYSALGADLERDAIVLVADSEDKARAALKAVIERAKYALVGVPEETRAANPDGTTRYMRPRPGAARMYPETDVPPILIANDLLMAADKLVPEHPDLKLKRFTEKHGLSRSLAIAIINDLRLDLYEYLVERYGEKVSPSVIASILVNTIPMLRREGIPIDDVSEDVLEELVKCLAEGVVAKEAIPEILTYIARNPGSTVIQAVEVLGLRRPPLEELDKHIENTIRVNREKLLARPDKAFSIVMSEVMRVFRGRIDGSIVAERVKSKLREILSINV